MKQQANTAAIYLRLSRDDGGDAESNSIGNQREMLRRFAKDNNMKIFSEYVEIISLSLIQCLLNIKGSICNNFPTIKASSDYIVPIAEAF